MARFTLYTQEQTPLDWSASGVKRVLQNVANLLRLIRYDVAFNRTLGMDPALPDRRPAEAVPLYIQEVYRLVESNEPRARVVSVEMESLTPQGQANMKVVLEIADNIY